MLQSSKLHELTVEFLITRSVYCILVMRLPQQQNTKPYKHYDSTSSWKNILNKLSGQLDSYVSMES
jgi:hypothetical protein